MRNRAALVVGVLALAGVAVLVWWLRRGDAGTAPKPKGGSAAVAPKSGRPVVQLSRPASVRGKVTREADGTGVGAAVVSLARAELGASFSQVTVPAIIVTADATGAWEATNVAPGEYMIAATAKGFLPSARAKLAIASGEERTGIDLALQPGGTIVSGTVSDVGGGPIGAARVTARRSEWSLKAGAELVALTGADGTYELSLPDGAYRLTAEHDDYTRDDDRAEVAGKPLVVDFTLIPGAAIRGIVVARDTRKPVPGAIVQVEGGRGRGRASTAFADEEGRFVLRSLGSGAVALTARGRGYASASPTTVQVGIGEEAADVQVLVDGAFSIIGKTVKKQGTQEPIAGARVGGFSMTGGGAEALAPTDVEGMFEIAGLRPGSYMIFAAAENTMIEIGKQVEVVDKDVTDVVIELATGVSLAGRVEPPGPATVGIEIEGEVGLANMFEAAKTMMVKAEADASGAFKLANVPPGKFQVSARTKEGSTGKQAVTVAAVDQSGVVVMLTKRASIAGRVVDTNGKPQPNIRLMATPDEKKGGFRFSSGMMDRDVASGPDGTFKIVGLDPGKYDVRVRDFEAMMAMPDKDRKKTLVEVSEGQDKAGVTVTVEARDGVIKGTVVGGDGKPTPDAWVTATRERSKGGEGDDFRARWSRTQSDPALTGPDGRFTITKLRTGSYTVVADGPRGASRGEKTGVKAGDSTQIQLASLGTLVVTVTQRTQPVKAYDLACDSAAYDVERHAASEDGTYKLENLPPGEYTCKVDSDIGTGEGKVNVPTTEAKLAVTLSVFGSLAGEVVSVLSGKPIPDLDVVAQSEGRSQRGFLEAMTGKGKKTGPDGKFVVERVPAGKGKLLFAGKAGFGAMESHDFVAREGERVDLGQIKIVPPRTTEAGTYGFATEPRGDVLEITSVAPSSPAEAAGLVVGDKIVTVETFPVKAIGVEIVKKLLSSGTVGVGQTVRLGLEKGTTVSVTSVKW